MKHFLFLISVLFCTGLNAQNTLKIGENTDFKTIKDGKVTVIMTPINPLSDSELNSIDIWAEENKQLMTISHDGATIIFKINAENNERNTYLKLWSQMGVSFLELTNNGSTIKLTIEEALAKFGL